jgi:hypothetical protein
MQAESLEILEKADVAPAQARAIVRAIEIEIAGAKDTLATKQDLAALRQDFATLRQDFATLRQEVRHDIELLRKEMYELIATLRGELKAEIHATVSGVTRQMYLAVLGQMAVLLGFAYFFATHVR